MKYSCYYIIHLGCLMGFTMYFYITFGTNLLTQSPVPVFVFFPCFSVSQKRNIKRSPNGMKPSEKLFLERKQYRRLGVHVRGSTRRARGRGSPPPGRALHPRGPLVAPLTYFPHLYISIYPKTTRGHNRSGVPPPEASVATENQSRPVLAPCRRGNPSPVAIFITPVLSMTRRE